MRARLIKFSSSRKTDTSGSILFACLCDARRQGGGRNEEHFLRWPSNPVIPFMRIALIIDLTEPPGVLIVFEIVSLSTPSKNRVKK